MKTTIILLVLIATVVASNHLLAQSDVEGTLPICESTGNEGPEGDRDCGVEIHPNPSVGGGGGTPQPGGQTYDIDYDGASDYVIFWAMIDMRALQLYNRERAQFIHILSDGAELPWLEIWTRRHDTGYLLEFITAETPPPWQSTALLPSGCISLKLRWTSRRSVYVATLHSLPNCNIVDRVSISRPDQKSWATSIPPSSLTLGNLDFMGSSAQSDRGYIKVVPYANRHQ